MLIKNVVIAHDFLNGPTFTKDISLEFVPDELIIEQVVYCNDKTETGLGILDSDLNNGTMCIFMDGSSQILNCSYPLGRPINGTYTFSAKEIHGGVSLSANGQIGLILQFIKH